MNETNKPFRTARDCVQIGNIVLENPVVAAPMAGVTDRAFRVLARESGCALVCTEMISAQAVMHNNEKTFKMMDVRGEKGPVSVQLFGSNPGYMARSARLACEYGADIIDINVGCPTPKIVNNGEGAALMKEPSLAAEIVCAVVEVSSVPVTVKMRKGWNAQSVNAVEVARAVEKSGASAVAVHGRTRDQFYSGSADWDIITEVKKNVNIPVIGNGDIFTPRDAAAMMGKTGCEAVMVGRGALGNPWIFSVVVKYLQEGVELPPSSNKEKLQTALRHLELQFLYKGEAALWEMRKHVAWYTKGMPGAARLREQVNKAKTIEELRNLIKTACEQL